MRIVDVNEFYSPTGGGVRSYLDRKMAIMADLGHELIVIAPGKENRVEERAGGGKIIYVEAPRLPFDHNYGIFWDAEPIVSLLDEFDPDVVECSSPWRPAWIVAGWKGRAVKAFFMHNDNVESYPKRWFGTVASPERIERAFAWYSRYMGRFLEQFDTVVSNGPALVKRMAERGVRVDAAVDLGIERQHFSPSLRSETLRRALLAQCDLPEDGHLLLGVGRHHREKRWDMVIDAVERAGAHMPVGLVLIGHGVQTKALERQVAGSPHIRLFKPVYDRARMAQIMASCDAYIHGCDTETFGLVVSEALASGAPLIVPEEGGAFEVSRPHFAETFAANDARSCADAIERLFSRDQAMLRRAAAVAARTVVSDRDHAIALVEHYAKEIAARSALAA
ncbi:Glycosyl transferase family 1 [Sphingomonas sp. EC-HK361]|uniref:glycosyltransferase n=1 Tax=Sphingomonas sp. EC-HK361 TaxID=2038397 RepID=UPI0012561B6E|nr:glycosyltransferase [Sphingomonas sp. EC-HK361]VVT13893.1 Glycosyl transferase family 1 [Sphingomonas sp. EC-HK361]